MTTHHGSHAGLVSRVDAFRATPGDLDAIIVPTVRPGRHLSPALEMASELNCPLLCLSSGGSDPAEVVKIADAVDAEAIVIDVSRVLPRLLPGLATTRFIGERGFGRRNDLSGKRNLGLLVSQAMGWRKILFLDDDIQKLDANDLRALAGLLDEYDAVGLGNTGYPDNSVVCHAYREVGGRQDTFVSGGLLSVRADRLDGFFPDIYNEDWFFLHGATGIARAGFAHQDEYDPFEFVKRASDEELGDCLAEGLYWLRDEDLPPETAHDQRFWDRYLEGRRKLIDHVVDQLRSRWAEDNDARDRDAHDRRLASMAAARAVHDRITPELCTAFIRAWEADLTAWRGHRSRVTAPATVEDCLRQLERHHSPDTDTDWTARVHRPS